MKKSFWVQYMSLAIGLEKRSPARKANWSMPVRSVRKKTMFSHMMKFLLTELGRIGRENIWLSIRTSWFWVKYFPVRLSHSVNKYIFCFRFCEMILQLQQRICLAVMKDSDNDIGWNSTTTVCCAWYNIYYLKIYNLRN